MNIPDDLKQFLQSGKRLEYDTEFCEPGQIELLPLEGLRLGEIRIEPSFDSEAKDPHYDEDGYYFIPAVNLVAKAEGYDPEYILAWLPTDGVYGAHDNEHNTLVVFPDTTWTDIVSNPRPFVEAQWEHGCGVPFAPTAAHVFRPGR